MIGKNSFICWFNISAVYYYDGQGYYLFKDVRYE